MKRNLIIQIYCNLNGINFNSLNPHNELKDLSEGLARRYAEKCNADYVLLDKMVLNFRHPTYERFRLWEEDQWFEKYNHIMYLDSDVLCWPEAPNVFEKYSGPNFKVAQHVHWKPYQGDAAKVVDSGYFKGWNKKKMDRQCDFNCGMFILTKESRDIMRPFLEYRNHPENWHDCISLHKMVYDSQVPLDILPARWNMKNGNRTKSYFAHLWGQQKHKLGKDFAPIREAKLIMGK